MVEKVYKMVDGNEAAASVAHRLNEVIVIYPITPSSPMAEFSEEWSSKGIKNIFGAIPQVQEMQSEAGAAGACHGAIQSGALTTTFTASQGLLLMIPNMYKIAGELSPFVIHVAARTLATHALSIFGDHSDVMACRQIGFGMLSSNSVQEAHDFAAIAQMSSLASRVPFMHFFDGFRTSHEVNKIQYLSDDDLKNLAKDLPVYFNLENSLTPDNPVIRGTAQNADVFFQTREASNKYYDKVEEIVEAQMKTFKKITGREYNLVEYVGAKDATHVIVMMGSGAETAHETVEYLNKNGKKVGLLKIRLYRPFPKKALIKMLPLSIKNLYVLDRTKECGAAGEPLYIDVMDTIAEAFSSSRIKNMPKIFRGRYGLSSKEFTPAMVNAVFENERKTHFTVGINDDLTGLSLDVDEHFNIPNDKTVRAVFYGLGADGTVGANKNSIKIIADSEDRFGQGYFVYDSKKSGAMTVSHLRFSPEYIRSAYLIKQADFLACHHFPFMEKIDILSSVKNGGTFLLNSYYSEDEVWDKLPKQAQRQIIDKKLKFYHINAEIVAEKTGMGRRINTIMQTCFFAISGVLPREEAILQIKKAIDKTYGKKSQEIVLKNYEAVDAALDYLKEINYPNKVTSKKNMSKIVPDNAPDFVKNLTARIMAGQGDEIKTSEIAITADGTWPTATTQYEKRCVAISVPVWDSEICIQCGKCAMVCPHAAIRIKAIKPEDLKKEPKTFKTIDYKGKEFDGYKFSVQVSPEDCTGCGICVSNCPVKNKNIEGQKAINMMPITDEIMANESENFSYFMKLPDINRGDIELKLTKNVQLLRPLFEFSGACAGCGETPYVKLATQLFGDRMVVANATGCSSIYGGNLPTTPYCVDCKGRGPAWSNSLFEDNAEFGVGMRFAIRQQQSFAISLLSELKDQVGAEFVQQIIEADMENDAGIEAQRERVLELKKKLKKIKGEKAKHLTKLADYLVKRSVWIIGGDGWAYDIGYGGLDHVLYSGENVNILVLDTGVYSNTGGQQSKATPMGASAKFAAAGKEKYKKDLGLIAMAAENAYVAQVAIGANDTQTIKAFREAESFNGPSLIIAYSHCIAHGYDLSLGLSQQKNAVDSGFWPLFRYDPRLREQGLSPLQLDSKEPSLSIEQFMENETRFKIAKRVNPDRYAELVKEADDNVKRKYAYYKYLSEFKG